MRNQRGWIYGLSVGLALTLAYQPSYAASPCDSVDTQVTKQLKLQYSKLIAKSVGQKVKASEVGIDKYMRAEDWVVIYADVPVADPGYFFFDASSGNPIFKDVWGGMAEKSDLPNLVKWARKLGAGPKIASCFAADATED